MSERELRELLRKAKVRHLLTECIDSSCPTCIAIDGALADPPDAAKVLRKTKAMLDQVNVDLATKPQNIVTYDQLVGMQNTLDKIVSWLAEEIIRLTDDGRWEWTDDTS